MKHYTAVPELYKYLLAVSYNKAPTVPTYDWNACLQTSKYTPRDGQAVAPATPSFTGSIFTSQEDLADNDDIWNDILQAAEVTVKPKQPEVRRCSECSSCLVSTLYARPCTMFVVT